ncbi:MAG: c-type cytochrome [Gammaproteobacteria bacterium]
MYLRVWTLVVAVSLLGACADVEDSGKEISLELKNRLRVEAVAYEELGVGPLSSDPAALKLGTELYAAYCASCHGSDGRGKEGVTNLVAGEFAYGSDETAIRSTISNGRRSEMPPLGRHLGEVEIGQIVAYVQSLTSDRPTSTMAERGDQLFVENCAVCHGPDGAGKTELGAPSLLDSYWQHGNSMMAIRLAITRGLEALCPPQSENLSAPEVDLLTAYVMNLNGSTFSTETLTLSELPGSKSSMVR